MYADFDKLAATGLDSEDAATLAADRVQLEKVKQLYTDTIAPLATRNNLTGASTSASGPSSSATSAPRPTRSGTC